MSENGLKYKIGDKVKCHYTHPMGVPILCEGTIGDVSEEHKAYLIHTTEGIKIAVREENISEKVGE